MSNIRYTNDDRLPPNTIAAGTAEEPEQYIVQHGRRDDGEKGLSVVDMDAEMDESALTQVDYAFREAHGFLVHEFTGLHRHGPDGDPEGAPGECEQAPAAEYPAPEMVRQIAIEISDMPVAGREVDEE